MSVLMLEPLGGAYGPCGEDMTFSSEFDEIQEARRFDDPSLSQGEWVTTVKEADWNAVIRLCRRLLETRSKDLRLAAWMTEAQGKTRGLDGLTSGYELLGQLCELFWGDIHPRADGDDEQEARIGVLDWLVNQTSRLIREIPLTKSAKGAYSSIDRECARTTSRNIELNPDLADELIRTAVVTMETFESALKDTPVAYFSDGVQACERLKLAMKRLQQQLDARLGEDAPAFSQAFDTLGEIAHFFQRHAGYPAKPEAHQEPAADQFDLPEDGERREPRIGDTETESSAGFRGPIRSREQAIHQLAEIARFFRQTEPHSPVAYLADKAARWGSMPLHVWLRTVVKDESALSRMEELLGVEDIDPEAGNA